MTGAPIPQGADVVVMYEKTTFTEDKVILTESVRSGDNIVRAGEDIRQGELLAEREAVLIVGLREHWHLRENSIRRYIENHE